MAEAPGPKRVPDARLKVGRSLGLLRRPADDDGDRKHRTFGRARVHEETLAVRGDIVVVPGFDDREDPALKERTWRPGLQLRARSDLHAHCLSIRLSRV